MSDGFATAYGLSLLQRMSIFATAHAYLCYSVIFIFATAGIAISATAHITIFATAHITIFATVHVYLCYSVIFIFATAGIVISATAHIHISATVRITIFATSLFLSLLQRMSISATASLFTSPFWFTHADSTDSTTRLSPANMKSFVDAVASDFTTFILVRWFKSGPTSERDSKYLPVCPGPLNINHCIWKYASTQSRRVMVNHDGNPTKSFRQHACYFGDSADEQLQRFEMEKKTYYGLMAPDDVLCTVNMCPMFYTNSAELNHSDWLETVTML